MEAPRVACVQWRTVIVPQLYKRTSQVLGKPVARLLVLPPVASVCAYSGAGVTLDSGRSCIATRVIAEIVAARTAKTKMGEPEGLRITRPPADPILPRSALIKLRISQYYAPGRQSGSTMSEKDDIERRCNAQRP